jgi:hypothetical protein
LVAYKAISGWKMYFRVNLEPAADCTLVAVTIEFSLGSKVLDRLLRLLVEWGLGRVCRNGLQKEGIRTQTVGRCHAMSEAG